MAGGADIPHKERKNKWQLAAREHKDKLDNVGLTLSVFFTMATLCDVPDNQESEDEFEEEMKQELEKRAREAQKGGAEKYESIYFDSDEDQDEEEQDSRMHKRTDDDLLYDPEEDDQHQKYIDKIRRQYQPRIKTG